MEVIVRAVSIAVVSCNGGGNGGIDIYGDGGRGGGLAVIMLMTPSVAEVV